jgi:hypothetical protein
MNSADCNLPEQVINQPKIRWALSNFKPFKSAGTYGIVPAHLQQGVEFLVPHSCCIFRACMAYGFIPMASEKVRDMFTPKPGKVYYTQA